MSRFANILTMYFILEERKLVPVKEIAERLGVSPRAVKGYKNDLEEIGVYVGSELGRHGGYYLESKMTLRNIDFTDREITALKMAKETINNSEYHYSKNFDMAIAKILNSKDNAGQVPYYNTIISASHKSLKKERKTWNHINEAIGQKRKIEMDYKALKPSGIEIKTRIVRPFGIFDYKGSTYFYAYCELASDIRYFKFSRISSCKILQEEFDNEYDFDFNKERENSFGIYSDEPIKLKLKIQYPMSEIVKEKAICCNQTITIIDEKNIYFEAEMKGFTEIKSWVMSMGSSVEVIEPEKLRKEIIEEMDKIRLMYEKKI